MPEKSKSTARTTRSTSGGVAPIYPFGIESSRNKDKSKNDPLHPKQRKDQRVAASKEKKAQRFREESLDDEQAGESSKNRAQEESVPPPSPTHSTSSRDENPSEPNSRGSSPSVVEPTPLPYEFRFGEEFPEELRQKLLEGQQVLRSSNS